MKLPHLVLLVLATAALLVQASAYGHDTTKPVEDAIVQVADWYSQEFGADREGAILYMMEIGNAQSGLGTDDDTYEPGGGYGWAQFYGGSNGLFTFVQDRLVRHPDRVSAILERWGFDPLTIPPGYLDESDVASAVFLREFLLSDPRSIPRTLDERAERWSSYGHGSSLDYKELNTGMKSLVSSTVPDFDLSAVQRRPHETAEDVGGTIDRVVDWYAGAGRDVGVPEFDKELAREYMYEIGNLQSGLGTDDDTYEPWGGYGWAQFEDGENEPFYFVQGRLERDPEKAERIGKDLGVPVDTGIGYLDDSDTASAVYTFEEILSNPEPIPKTLEERATEWSAYFGHGKGDEYVQKNRDFVFPKIQEMKEVDTKEKKKTVFDFSRDYRGEGYCESKVPITAVIEEVSQWYADNYPELVPNAEKAKQILTEVGNVESGMGTHPLTYERTDKSPSVGWAQFSPASGTAFDDVRLRGITRGRADAVEQEWGFDPLDKDLTVKDLYDSTGGDGYKEDVASAVFAIEYVLLLGNKIGDVETYERTKSVDESGRIKHGTIKWKDFDPPAMDEDFEGRARWWAYLYNSLYDPSGTPELYKEKNLWKDKNGEGWIYSGNTEEETQRRILESDEGEERLFHVAWEDGKEDYTDARPLPDIRTVGLTDGIGCIWINYCDDYYTKPIAKEFEERIKLSDGWKEGRFFISPAADIRDGEPTLYGNPNTNGPSDQISSQGCGYYGFFGAWYEGCDIDREDFISGWKETFSKNVGSRAQMNTFPVALAMDNADFDDKLADFFSISTVGGLFWRDRTLEGSGALQGSLTTDEIKQIMKEVTPYVPADTGITGFSSSTSILGTSVYMTRNRTTFTYSGKAYQILPSVRFARPVNLTLLDNGEDFSSGGGTFIYRFEDSEIERNCNITILRDVEDKVGKEAAELSIGDLSLEVPENALDEGRDMVVREVLLHCREDLGGANASVVAATNATNTTNQTSEANGTGTGPGTDVGPGGGNGLPYLITAVLIAIIAVLVWSKKKR